MGETTDEVRSLDEGNDDARSRATSGGLAHEGADDSSKEAAQIRSGIEQTRSNLSETIDALQHKLDPSHIAEQVKEQIREKATEAYETARDAVKEATIGKAEKIMASVSETVSDVTGRASTAVMDTSSSFVQYIRDNPIPFALLGIGIGMLTLNRGKSQQVTYSPNVQPNAYPSEAASQASLTDRAREMVSGAASTVADNARSVADRATTAVTSAASTVRDAAGTAADTTLQKFHDVTAQTRQGARTANDFFKTTLQENPMALGIAAVAAGALVGLTLPTTRLEGEYMGEARDRLVDQAKSVAQDAADQSAAGHRRSRTQAEGCCARGRPDG